MAPLLANGLYSGCVYVFAQLGVLRSHCGTFGCWWIILQVTFGLRLCLLLDSIKHIFHMLLKEDFHCGMSEVNRLPASRSAANLLSY